MYYINYKKINDKTLSRPVFARPFLLVRSLLTDPESQRLLVFFVCLLFVCSFVFFLFVCLFFFVKYMVVRVEFEHMRY